MVMRKPLGRRLLRSSKQVIVPRWQQKPMFMLTRTRVKWCSMHISASACSKRVFSIALNLFRNREEKRFLKSPPSSDECADNRHFCYSSNNLSVFLPDNRLCYSPVRIPHAVTRVTTLSPPEISSSML